MFNGYGKTTGLVQLAELGVLETPILLTNTLSVFTAANALVTYSLERNPEIGRAGGTVNPVVGECSDAYLNDIRARHVTEDDCLEALRMARSGPVAEGNVGAGTGMSCLGLKGGVGTASRVVVPAADPGPDPGAESGGGAGVGSGASPGAGLGTGPGAGSTLGCLVVANFGRLEELRLDGVPVGRELLAAGWPEIAGPPATAEEQQAGAAAAEASDEAGGSGGSVMIILATDWPLSCRQLTRLARRAVLGLGRLGATGAHGSGDFVLAFSVAELEPAVAGAPVLHRRVLAEDDRRLGPLFAAAVESTEEAVANALFAAETMTGREGRRREALPVGKAAEILRRHGRLAERL